MCEYFSHIRPIWVGLDARVSPDLYIVVSITGRILMEWFGKANKLLKKAEKKALKEGNKAANKIEQMETPPIDDSSNYEWISATYWWQVLI